MWCLCKLRVPHSLILFSECELEYQVQLFSDRTNSKTQSVGVTEITVPVQLKGDMNRIQLV